MNEIMQNFNRQHRLMTASLRVRKESMRVNGEFSAIECDPIES